VTEPSLEWLPLWDAFEDGEPNLFSLLRWDYRLVETLYGRDDDLRKILGWAESGSKTASARLIAGEGGAGKTRLTKAGEPWFCVAGIWRADKDVGEAFTMLTMPPGPDIAPYHDRQIVILDRADWAAWLDPSVPAQSLIRPLRAGELKIERAG
jgi:hypothetical protein